jgi:hypothetical protein
MPFSIKYKILFKVNILHLYSLNKGINEFHSMSEGDKEKQLDSYNINDFFTILPTSDTSTRLYGSNLVFKKSDTGFSIWSKVSDIDDTVPFIPLNEELYFTFLIKLADSLFYNYTDLKFSNSGKLYYFSNRRLSTESNSFPVINKEGDNNSINETYIIKTDIEKDEDWKLIPDNEKFDLDWLSTGEKDRLFGVIRIFMRGIDSTVHVVDSQCHIQTPYPIFQIQLNNRKTFWRYIFRQDQTLNGSSDVEIEGTDPKILITTVEQPLTEKGFISIQLKGIELPNPNANLVKPSTTSDEIYSDTYM